MASESSHPSAFSASGGLEHEFVEIPIGDFVRGKSVEFDIYIRLSPEGENPGSGKFIKLARGAEDLGQDRIEVLAQKGIESLYLKKDDFNKYLVFESMIIAAAAQSDLKIEKKMQLVRVTLEVMQRKFSHCDLSDDDFRVSSKVVENALLVLGTLADGASLISSLEGASSSLYSHSSAVSMVCTLIAKRLHWSSSSTLRKVALAGLFHDIGKRDFPREIIDLRTSQIPDSHRALYETHPILGSEILKRSKAIPLDVANAVLQHHEYINGAGFPHGLRLGKIQPIALILNLADEFSHQVMELDNPTKEDIHGILRKMMEEDWQKYAGEALVALHELFGLQVDAQLENKLMRGVLSAG